MLHHFHTSSAFGFSDVLLLRTIPDQSSCFPSFDDRNIAIRLEQKISNILNGARAKHTEAVQSRIDSVEQQKDVVSLTEALYAVAKETAQTEKEVFELRQKTALAGEVKSVLDSWVRFEASEREQEQRELAASVIKKVQDSLKDDKLQKQILDNAVAEIENLVKSKAI